MLFGVGAAALGLAGLFTGGGRSTGYLLRLIGTLGVCLMLYVVFIQSLDGWATQPRVPDVETVLESDESEPASPEEELGVDMAEAMGDEMTRQVTEEMNMSVHLKWPVFASLTLFAFISACGIGLSARKKKQS